MAVGNWTKFLCPCRNFRNEGWRCVSRKHYSSALSQLTFLVSNTYTSPFTIKWSTFNILRLTHQEKLMRITSFWHSDWWWISQTTVFCHSFLALLLVSQFSQGMLSLVVILCYNPLQLFRPSRLPVPVVSAYNFTDIY